MLERPKLPAPGEHPGIMTQEGGRKIGRCSSIEEYFQSFPTAYNAHKVMKY